MASTKEKRDKIAEFGDFQTPEVLAREACRLLIKHELDPRSIVEPTCGTGTFLLAAMDEFSCADTALGIDIRADYVDRAAERLTSHHDRVTVRCANFFATAWLDVFGDLPQPILVIGNPPWVTNSHLGALGSKNLPTKSNFQEHSGIAALTGKGNFDISEWMLIHLLECLQGKQASIAVFCKTATARKTLFHAWKNDLRVENSTIYSIDALTHFGASVDACFLVLRTGLGRKSYDCGVFESLDHPEPSYVFGYRENQLVGNLELYDRWKHLQGSDQFRWRSGIKHDCAAVMELHRVGDEFENGLGERVKLESRYVYPMIKSSGIANGNVHQTERWMLVPQTTTGEDTRQIEENAPLTWAYLQLRGHLLDRRKSSIYKNRPRFSIFGVGSYSFAPWKVAVSGFYKSLRFRTLGPIDGRPIVLDDTVNFIPCESRAEAEWIATLLNSPSATEFLNAFVFWDAKRPITVDVLRKLDLDLLAEANGARPFASLNQLGTWKTIRQEIFSLSPAILH